MGGIYFGAPMGIVVLALTTRFCGILLAQGMESPAMWMARDDCFNLPLAGDFFFKGEKSNV